MWALILFMPATVFIQIKSGPGFPIYGAGIVPVLVESSNACWNINLACVFCVISSVITAVSRICSGEYICKVSWDTRTVFLFCFWLGFFFPFCLHALYSAFLYTNLRLQWGLCLSIVSDQQNVFCWIIVQSIWHNSINWKEISSLLFWT